MSMFELSDQVRDRITGFAGIVTGHARYLYKADEFCVENVAPADGIYREYWFPGARLEPVQVQPGEDEPREAERKRYLLSE